MRVQTALFAAVARKQTAGLACLVAVGIDQTLDALLGYRIARGLVRVPAIRLDQTSDADRVRHVAHRSAAAAVPVGRARRNAVVRSVAGSTIRTIAGNQALDAVAGGGVTDSIGSDAGPARRGARVAGRAGGARRACRACRAGSVRNGGVGSSSIHDAGATAGTGDSRRTAATGAPARSRRATSARGARGSARASGRALAAGIRPGAAAGSERCAVVVGTATR
jgi:hypothetical protein